MTEIENLSESPRSPADVSVANGKKPETKLLLLQIRHREEFWDIDLEDESILQIEGIDFVPE